MYLRHTTVTQNGKTHTYWRLVRSVRTDRAQSILLDRLGLKLPERLRLPRGVTPM